MKQQKFQQEVCNYKIESLIVPSVKRSCKLADRLFLDVFNDLNTKSNLHKSCEKPIRSEVSYQIFIVCQLEMPTVAGHHISNSCLLQSQIMKRTAISLCWDILTRCSLYVTTSVISGCSYMSLQ